MIDAYQADGIFHVTPAYPMKLSEIACLFGCRTPAQNAEIRAITTDSRLCEKGDLFFAIKGEHQDGADYLEDVKTRGGFAVSERPLDGVIPVKNAKNALLTLAAYYRKRFFANVPLIAVTGSVGKTTAKEYLAALLSARRRVSYSKNNHNNEIGIPMSMLSAEKDCALLLLEMGMNAPGELSRYSEALKPNYAVITKIGTAHVGAFGSREAIAKAKKEITDGMPETAGRVLIPAGEPLLSDIPGAVRVSADEKDADFALLDTQDGTFLFHGGKKITGRLPPLPNGADLRECLAFAAALGYLLGVTEEELNGFLLHAELPKRRIPEKVRDFYLLDDSYNASPESMIAGMDAAVKTDFSSRSALLGDMEELGTYTEDLHRQIGLAAARRGFGNLFLFGRFAPFYAAGAKEGGMPDERIFINTDPYDPEKTAQTILTHTGSGELLFAKASHKIGLYRVLNLLKSDNFRF